MTAGIRVALALLLAPAPLAAQGFLERFSYEGLRLSGVGIEFGVVASDRLTSEPTAALRVDYGFIAPNTRLLFGVAYFKGEFSADEIAKFEARLRGVVRDPTSDFTIDVGSISLADIAGSIDLQYMFNPGGEVTPYLGLGLGVHVRNAAGLAIEGTFVDDALGTIAAGAAVSAGLEVTMTRWLRLTTDLRGEVTGELRTFTARGGLMFRFPRRDTP